MNSNNYKKAFQGVQPSQARIERILSMTETNRKTYFRATMVPLLVILGILFCGTCAFAINEVSDGAIETAIENAKEDLYIFLNVESENTSDYTIEKEKVTNEDGISGTIYNISIPNEETGESEEFVIESYGEEGDFICSSINADGKTYVFSNIDNPEIPTTALAELEKEVAEVNNK